MDLDELQKHLDKIVQDQNNRAIADFEGYSPSEMHHILHFTFDPKSPLKLQKLAGPDFLECPMFNLVKYLLDVVDRKGEVKLTAKGFLPTKLVQDIYDQGFLEEWQFSSGISKLYKEADSYTVNLTRLLAELAALTKKRKGKLSLTKKGERLIKDNQKLFEAIFEAMTHKFNWAYYDAYEDQRLGQFGFGFSLILLSRYGAKSRQDSFYAEKYLKAFPHFLTSFAPRFRTAEEYASSCYSVRTFDRFLHFFGLVKIEQKGKFIDRERFIMKTALFDKLIKVRPHSSAGH